MAGDQLQALNGLFQILGSLVAVSYTHLDVYKRQIYYLQITGKYKPLAPAGPSVDVSVEDDPEPAPEPEAEPRDEGVKRNKWN